MKCIVAFIKPNMRDDVVFALHALAGFPGATLSEVRDIGAGIAPATAPDKDTRRGFLQPILLRLEIVCQDDICEQIVALIAQKAHTGLPDDGWIVVSPVQDVRHIRSGKHRAAEG